MQLLVEFEDDSQEFLIRTPQLLPKVSEWVGWRRTPQGNYRAPAYVSSVLSMTIECRWTPEARVRREELIDRLQRAKTMLELSPKTPLPTRRVQPTERMPKRHQEQAIHAIRLMEYRALLGDDMGLGKTSTALWCAHESGAAGMLICCPVSVKFNWQEEIRETLGLRWLSTVINGTPKRRANQIADALFAVREGHRLAVIVNYDLLRHLSDEQREWFQAFAEQSICLLDESHYLKNKASNRSREVVEITARAKRVIAMTGTPIRNNAEDLFQQLDIVRPGVWTSYRDFAKRHLVVQKVKFGKREVQKVVGTKNLDDLNAVLNTMIVQRKKGDVLDLPEKTYTYPMLELNGPLLKLYDAMKQFARMTLADLMEADPTTTVFDPRAKSAVEQAMRCEQIAQGFVGGIPEPVMDQLGEGILRGAQKLPGRPNELVFPAAPKLVWLLDTITDLVSAGAAPIVYTRFNAPMQWLAAELNERGLRPVVLDGSLPATIRQTFINDFKEGIANVLICQVKIAEGWNATRCQDVLFLGRDWSPAINAQAEDRAHRMGQKGTVNVQIPIVLKTIEVMLDQRLRAKDAAAQQALKPMTIAELMDGL